MRKANTIFNILLLFLSLIILSNLSSCKHEDSVLPKNYPNSILAVKQWLNTDGQAYKNETIYIKTPNSTQMRGRLDWESAKKYNWNGADYIDIPYVFENQTKVPGFEKGTSASFDLVIRIKTDGIYEGAIRNIMYNVETVTSDKKMQRRNFQDYYLLDGTPANAWMSNTSSDKPIPAYRLNNNAIKGNTRRDNQRVMTVCETMTVISYGGNCNYWVGEVVLGKKVNFIDPCL